MPPDAPPKDPTPATTTAAIPVVRATPATRATRAALPIAPIPPVRADQYGSVDVRRANRRIRDERRAHYRSRWWFPVLIVLAILAGFWGSLKTDQMIAETLIWPSHGARFVEVSSSLPDAQRLGGRLTIVVAGLGRTSGTGVALALLPSLEAGDTRVFSLVYGSGINDEDIRDKFDALVAQTQPSEISFFGSSMGGDVVLQLAAHAQQLRSEYRPAGSGSGDSREGAGLSPGPRPMVSQAGKGVPGMVPPADTRSGWLPAFLRLGRPADPPPATGDPADPALAGHPDPADAAAGSAPVPPPRLGTIFLDCTPLSTADVRNSSRTRADALTALTEALGTDGGAITRVTAEMLAAQRQFSTGRFPFLQIRRDDFVDKFDQVMHEKIGGPGASTQLLKEQYGVIRRTNIDEIVNALGPGVRVVYFLPQTRRDDRTVRVEQVEATLRRLATADGLEVSVVEIPAGHHASAESNPESYQLGIKRAADVGS